MTRTSTFGLGHGLLVTMLIVIGWLGLGYAKSVWESLSGQTQSIICWAIVIIAIISALIWARKER